MEALRPRNRNPVPFGRGHEAERRLPRQRTMPLAVEVHLPAELAVAAGILARHVVDLLGRAGVDSERGRSRGVE